jgi:hypothetical protein
MVDAVAASSDIAGFWRRTARRLAFRVNLAAWWERWMTPAVIASALAAVAVNAARRQAVDPARIWTVFAVALLLTAFDAARRARRHFFSEAAALVELDVALGLKNRLASARQGVGPWPTIPTRRPRVVRWKASRLLVPPLFALSILCVAGFIPVSKAKEPAVAPTTAPSSWKDVDDWLRGLEKKELAAPETVQTWEERLSRLRRQPEGVWYSHGSLEAGDTLRQQLETGLRSMGNDLDQAADALESMESVGGKSHDAGSSEAGQELDRAMQRLESGTVPLHPDLLSQLKGLKGASGRKLSLTELEKLRRRLREGSGFCRLSIRECPLGHKDCTNGACRRWGVDRGPGSVPLALEADASRTGSKLLEGVSNEDLQHAALGETIGLTRTAHRVDRGARTAPMRGGAVATAPGGGEAVWRDTLTPEEQLVLQRYFK